MSKEQFKTKYIDKHCLTHVLPYTFSENGILFTAYMAALGLVSVAEAKIALHHTERIDPQGRRCFDPQPFDDNHSKTHFSKDNMLGVYYLRHFVGRDFKGLPNFAWNGDKSRNPIAGIFFKSCKSKCAYFFFKYIMYAASKITYKKERKHSSGKMRWILKWDLLQKLGHKSARKFSSKNFEQAKKEHGISPYDDIRKIYFTKNGEYIGVNDDHPILRSLK